MARRKRSAARTRTVTRTIVAQPRAASPTIRISAPAAIRSHGRRIGRHVRHYGGRALGAAKSEKHTLTAVGAAAVLGYLEKTGVQIPSVGPLGPAATAGLAAWLYGRYSKNQTAQHVATGLLCVAINRWAATGTIAGDAAVYED